MRTATQTSLNGGLAMIMELILKYAIPFITLVGSVAAIYLSGRSHQKAKDAIAQRDKAIEQMTKAHSIEIKAIKGAADEVAKVNTLSDPELDSELSKWVKPKSGNGN